MIFRRLQQVFRGWATASTAIALVWALPVPGARGAELATDGEPYPTTAAVWSISQAPVGVSAVTAGAPATAWPGELRLVVTNGRTGAALEAPATAPTGAPDGTLVMTQALPGVDVRIEHRVAARNGALFWQCVLTCAAPEEAWLELTWTTATTGLEAPRFYDGHDLHPDGRGRRDTIDQTFPVSTVFDATRGLAIGVSPGALISYLASRVDADGTWRYGTRFAIPPGEAAAVEFVLFNVRPVAGHLDAIDGFQQRFPRAFENPTDVDPRLVQFGGDTLGYARYRQDKADAADVVARAARIRAGYGSWDWAYAPFRRVGDWLGRPELWEWDMSADERERIRKSDGRSWFDLMDRERFEVTRREAWRNADLRLNTALTFYLINWLEENLAQRLGAEPFVYPYGDAGPRLSWVTSNSWELHVFPWASPFEDTIRRDLPELVRTLSLRGFALDVASNPSLYRGKLARYVPGWAYDDKGRYLHTGIGHRLLLDYLRSFSNDGYRLGVAGNGGDPFMVTAAIDVGLNEGKDQPNLRYEESRQGRYLCGGKRLHLHSGGGFDNPALNLDWQGLTPAQIRLFYQDHLNAWLLGCWQGGYVPGVMAVFGRESITRAMPVLIDVQGRGYRAVPGCEGQPALARARYGKGLQSVLAISNPTPTTVTGEERLSAPYFGRGSALAVAYDGQPLDLTVAGDTTRFRLEVARKHTRLVCVPVALRGPAGAALRLSGRSSGERQADRVAWRFELRADVAAPVQVVAEPPPDYALAAVVLNGTTLEPSSGSAALRPGDNLLTVSCRSLLFRSPEEALLGFPYARAALVLADGAGEREQAAAQMVQDFAATHEQVQLPAGGRDGGGPTLVIGGGGTPGITLSAAGPSLTIAGATPFATQQLTARLLRLLLERKIHYVHPFHDGLPIQPTRDMLAKIGVDRSGVFALVETAGLDVPEPMAKTQIAGVGVVRALLAKPEHSTTLQAGYCADDRLCAWAVKAPKLVDYRSVSVYVNADRQPTGRAGVADGTDWIVSAGRGKPGLTLTRYRDIPKEADGKTIVANSSSRAVAQYEGGLVQAGDVLYVLLERSFLAQKPPAADHRFYLLAYAADGTMFRATYSAQPTGSAAVAPVLNLGGPANPAQPGPLPVLEIPTLAAEPKVDGRLDEPLWGRAASIEYFTPLRNARLDEPTEAWAFFTAEALVLGFRCWESKPQYLNPGQCPRDAERIWTGAEHVEVFLAPGVAADAEAYPFYQFMTTPAGAQWDGYAMDVGWNAEWQAAAQLMDQGWTAEIRIPLARLQGGTGATTWRANVARFRALQREWATWAPVQGGLQKPAGFGVWRRAAPANDGRAPAAP